MVEIVVDPFASDEDMRTLWRSAWGSDGPASFAPILSRSLLHVGAFNSAQLVGFVNVAWDGGIHAFILDTCVHQDFRRKGIATRLVQCAVKRTRERGVQWLHVDYEAGLEQFYRQCGFKPTLAGLIRL